jgi:hypothetical protein
MAGKLITVWKTVRFYLCKLFRVKGHGISIIVPAHFSGFGREIRERNWRWLERYWRNNLPGAELIIGRDPQSDILPFSKSVAVNNGASASHGDVLVIVDADVFISVDNVLESVNDIRSAERKGHALWFIPYRRMFRLTEEASERFLTADPKGPLDIDFEIQPGAYANKGEFEGTPHSQIGNWYGAMIQVMSRKAFYAVGGWDHRFKGWGGEDHAAMTAMDTLYGPHKTLPCDILHIWHPVITADPLADPKEGKKRIWANQDPKASNDTLSHRYYYSRGNPKRMRSLVREFLDSKPSDKAAQQDPPPTSLSSS